MFSNNVEHGCILIKRRNKKTETRKQKRGNVEHGCILIKRRNKKTETRKQKRGDPGDHEKLKFK